MGGKGDKTGSESYNLESVASGASWYLVGRVVSAGLKFMLQVLLTRILGAAIYGIYTYAYSIVWLFVIIARFGTGKSLLRFIPEFESSPNKQNWVTRIAYGTAMFGSIIFSILLYFVAPAINSFTLDSTLLTTGLRIFAIVLPLNTFINLSNSVFRAVNKIEYQVLVENIATPIIQLVAVATAAVFGAKFIGIVGAIAASAILLFFITISILHNKISIEMLGDYESDSYRRFYRFSIPLTVKDIGQRIYSRSDILMIGILLVSIDIGVYKVAILLMGLLKIPLSGLNQIFPSVASKLHADGSVSELEHIYTVLTRWSLTMGLVPSLVLFTYPSLVLSLFGNEFSAGINILLLFVGAQLTNMAVGPSGFLLIMTDHQYLSMTNQWFGAILNVIGNYILIIRFGLIGAAIATASTLALINILRLLEVQMIEGMNPYKSNYWKPIAAGVCCGIIMQVSKTFTSGYKLLLLGSTFGIITFIMILVATGIEREDREMFNQIIKPRLKL